MFHDILPEEVNCFRRNLYFLKKYTNAISMDDFFAGRLKIDQVNTVITFDDGFKSWVNVATPILKNLGLPATFFVSSGLIGLSGEDEAAFFQSKLLSQKTLHGCLSYEDIRRIIQDGFTVGGHTLNHANLGKSKDTSRVRCEISEDKIRLEGIADRKIQYFSYPFGEYHNKEINLPKVLKETGYRGAVTTTSGFNTLGSDPFLLHREITPASMNSWVFRARVYGNYDAVTLIKQIVPTNIQRRLRLGDSL